MTAVGSRVKTQRVVLGVAVLLAAIAGCAEKKRTEIILGLATDLNAPSPLRSVALKVSHQPDDMVLATQMWSISGQPTLPDELPGSFAIYSASGTADRVRVELTGQDNFGKALVKRTAVLTLVPQRTLFVRLGVVTACLGVLDCGAGLTCVDGRCVSEEIDSSRLPEYKPGAEKEAACAGGTTFVNTSTKLPLTTSPATCTTGETCQEGVCLAPLSGTGGRAGTADAGTGGRTGTAGTDGGIDAMDAGDCLARQYFSVAWEVDRGGTVLTCMENPGSFIELSTSTGDLFSLTGGSCTDGNPLNWTSNSVGGFPVGTTVVSARLISDADFTVLSSATIPANLQVPIPACGAAHLTFGFAI